MLITHGSMNPVHQGHIRMMVRAKERLEAEGYTVVGGEIAITRQTHIANKGAPAMHDSVRLSLIDLASAAHGWLRGVDGSRHGSASQYIKSELQRWKRNFGSDVVAISVEGSDVILRYPPRDHAFERVVVVRDGDEEMAAHAVSQAKANVGLRAHLLPPDTEHSAASSTVARSALLRGDRASLVRFCGEAVAGALLAVPLDQIFVNPPDPVNAGLPPPSPMQPPSPMPPPVSSGASMQMQVLHVQEAAGGQAPPMTKAELSQRWRQLGRPAGVCGFYSTSGQFALFSNFFEHEPVEFDIPECCGAAQLHASGRHSPRLRFTFAEKAIMLCKASAMADYVTYDAIRATTAPKQAKALGRMVSPFDEDKWDRVVCTVARAVILAKVTALPTLASLLLSTGDALIAEATKRDKIWGIGLDVGEPNVQVPARWQGYNILGWALMEARDALRRAPTGAHGLPHMLPYPSGRGSCAGLVQQSQRADVDGDEVKEGGAKSRKRRSGRLQSNQYQ